MAETTYYYGKDARGERRWRLRADNNKIIATSGEGYNNKQDCLYGIQLVKGAKDAPEKEIDPF
jgi:uncharacterized protein YegP (UPF0339 family)